MKKLKFNAAILAVILLTSALSASADEEKYTKTLHREYDVNELILLDIDNRFGDLDITNRPQNKVVIDVIITVEAGSQEKAEKMFRFIDVGFSQNDTLIMAVTNIDEKIKQSCNRNAPTPYRVDYKVSIPIYLKMNLKNKYGNIHLDEVHGRLNLALKYGKLFADKLLFTETKPLSQVSVSYGKASINHINRCKLSSSYSEYTIGESAALILSSKYSEVHIGKNRALVVDSKYDEYEIDETNSIVIIGKYSGYEIGKINKKLDIDTKYTNTIVTDVNDDFEEIKIDNSYGNIEIGISKNVAYQLDAVGKYCNINYPKGGDVNVSSATSEVMISGKAGNGVTNGATVKINTRYGNVNLVK